MRTLRRVTVGIGVMGMLALASNASAQFVVASGGSYTNDIGAYRIHTYTNTTGTYSFDVGAIGGVVQVLVVAGGGGGGNGPSGGGGGGAGGLI